MKDDGLFSVLGMAAIQSEENLHKKFAYYIFRNASILFLSFFDENREIATAAVLHQDIQDVRILINAT